jgi:hypothetical protein
VELTFVGMVILPGNFVRISVWREARSMLSAFAAVFWAQDDEATVPIEGY